jgi:hypothetical protein
MNAELRLAEHPDGIGLCGEALTGDAVMHLQILPPAYLWAGYCPFRLDPRMWQVFADGELIARIERDEDVGPALLPLLQSAFAKTRSPVSAADMQPTNMDSIKTGGGDA